MLKLDAVDQEIVNKFASLYGGGLADKHRAQGVPDIEAMPAWSQTKWLGKGVAKSPIDLWMYQEIIFETKPEVIIETGTSGGGSAYFFATLFDLMGIDGRVVTIDLYYHEHLFKIHPRITYLTGDSTSDDIAAQVRGLAAGKRVMVSLDADHYYEPVARELELYGKLTSPGCYVVIEDTGIGACPVGDWASRAAYEFIRDNPDFVVDKDCECHLYTSNRDGWIKRLY